MYFVSYFSQLLLEPVLTDVQWNLSFCPECKISPSSQTGFLSIIKDFSLNGWCCSTIHNVHVYLSSIIWKVSNQGFNLYCYLLQLKLNRYSTNWKCFICFSGLKNCLLNSSLYLRIKYYYCNFMVCKSNHKRKIHKLWQGGQLFCCLTEWQLSQPFQKAL